MMNNYQDKYITFIDEIITNVLKGKIASKEIIYRRLVEALEPGTGEIFERCLIEKFNTLENQVKTESDELKQAKSLRQLRAIKLLQQAWEQWQKKYQAQSQCDVAVQQIIAVSSEERLGILLKFLDPNQSYLFKHPQIKQLAHSLQLAAENSTEELVAFELRQYAAGLIEGLSSITELEPHLISWIYDAPNRAVGFGEVVSHSGPWASWAKNVSHPLAKELFNLQAQNQSATAIISAQNTIDIKMWVGLMVLMRDLQMGLVTWFDKQAYSAKVGQDLSGVTFIVFAMIWSELSQGFQMTSMGSQKEQITHGCFKMTLQSLRAFAGRSNFPLYGGVFASFSGNTFRETIDYLDRPLNEVENIQEKARILTVLGYSQQWMGNYQKALDFHQEALELSRTTQDRACEIANLNHLSRLNWRNQDYNSAINQAQRALILARQTGDKTGEAYSLVSLGFCEVLISRQQRAVTAEQLESSINYLQQGLKLSEKLNNLLNKALSLTGLGIAYVTLEQPRQAVQVLEQGLSVVQSVGDINLQALGCAYIAEAYYQLQQNDLAVYLGCLGMYLLEQRGNLQWQQAAALMMILQGKLGEEQFEAILSKYRDKIIAQIGVDGFDYLPDLIERYRQQ
ncbi:MAG: tetratricopeptide repeat protein [Microcoleaceae cyanobacterium]